MLMLMLTDTKQAELAWYFDTFNERLIDLGFEHDTLSIIEWFKPRKAPHGFGEHRWRWQKKCRPRQSWIIILLAPLRLYRPPHFWNWQLTYSEFQEPIPKPLTKTLPPLRDSLMLYGKTLEELIEHLQQREKLSCWFDSAKLFPHKGK